MRSALACSPLVLVCAPLVVAFGCGSTDTSSGGGSSSSGPPTLAITAPAAGACVEVPTDRAAGVPITFAVGNIVLRPPGDCGLIEVCGHVLLYVGDKLNNGGANAVIDVLSMPDAPLEGPFEVTLRLVSDTGTPLVGASGSPVTASLALVAQTSCGAATTGSGGSGGTPSATGSGGMGGGLTTTGSGSGSGGSTTGSGGAGGMGGGLTTAGSGSGTGGTGGMGGGLSTTGSGSGSGGATTAGAGGSSSSGT